MKIELAPLAETDKENFIAEIQAEFKKSVAEEFGDDGSEVISREDVLGSIDEDGAETYRIICGGEIVGGAVLEIRADNRNELVLFFVRSGCHSKGIGTAAWLAIENLHPETISWETFTPYFAKRNINFYVNKCGFHIVEFYNPKNPMPEPPADNEPPFMKYFFRFEKVISKI